MELVIKLILLIIKDSYCIIFMVKLNQETGLMIPGTAMLIFSRALNCVTEDGIGAGGFCCRVMGMLGSMYRRVLIHINAILTISLKNLP